MHSVHQLFRHMRRHGLKPSPLYTASIMFFFWSIFDSLLSYVLPIKIIADGFSKTEMGLIIGSSSVVGAVFDFILSKFLKSPHYRRLYLSMFILSFVFLVFLYQANTLFWYIVAMGIWGLYWDISNFGSLDFVHRTSAKEGTASAFGVMGVLRSLGTLVAPVAAGILIAEKGITSVFVAAGVMLGLGASFYVSLSLEKSQKSTEVLAKPLSWWREIHAWRSIGKQLLPLLVLTLLFFINMAFFWTIGPLIAEDEALFGELGGFFLVAYLLPPLLLGFFVERFTNRFGKKRTALYSFLLGSIGMVALSFATNPLLLIAIVFLISSAISFVLPAISAAYCDYISETKSLEKEIEGISDLSYNAGWVAGPILAGIFSDMFGNTKSFTVLGIISIAITLILIKITPHKIRLHAVKA